MHWWQLPFSSSTIAKLRQNDVDSDSSSQPLPLPELLPPEPKAVPSAVPLPSPPRCRSLSRNEERDHHLKRSSVEHPEFRLSRKSAVKQESRRSSAPTSPVCSPSPYCHRIPPAIFRARSEPRNPHSNGNTGLSCSYQMPFDKISGSSVEVPPLITRSHSHVESAAEAGLTEASKISLEWRESFCHANVHTLPLPPGTPLSSTSHLSGAKQPSPIRSQWQKGKLIGRGTFGSVYVGSNRETGALCAMKEVEILPEDVKSQESIRQLQQEIKVLSKLKHPNIVQYYGSEIVGDKFYIYLEYVHPGSINKFIHDHSAAITESVVRNFTRHILCGLAYLHSTKTIHRDIKGANLLVDAHGVVKLADFGMAKHLNGEAVNLSLKGSPYWLAPELLQCVVPSADLGLAIDIWSLGCTIIQMINGKPPWSDYEGAAALFKVLKESPPIPEMLSAEGKDFLQCCFRRNPADRPAASKLLEHPFVDCSRISSTHLN
ncbi:mitogen-activated protein kinase kinase kinase 5-like [Salvia hispanica]|uniref:mitogen-activated protein kinase kinase kinase 5-like n=1 Tax=Salvia hispanica TaxID=49212 RepID=UPI002009D87E|nr:mitogen-activated protein kinase kinase kinase 5-like [Salvia hispanica]